LPIGKPHPVPGVPFFDESEAPVQFHGVGVRRAHEQLDLFNVAFGSGPASVRYAFGRKKNCRSAPKKIPRMRRRDEPTHRVERATP
jgi:hypothetical protein